MSAQELPAPASLRALQRRFLAEVVRVEALPRPPRRSAAARARASSLVLPSATLTPGARTAIYGRMYAARLEECLRADFPALLVLLGPARFSRLARRHVTHRPPSSWTLDDLGAHLALSVASAPGVPRRALARDVARLERAMSEAFDALDAVPLDAAALARAAPVAGADLRLTPHPTLRLLALETAANRAVTAAREGGAIPRRLPAGPTWVAVYRRELRVWRLDLTRPMHAALSALARGLTLGAALDAAARAFRGDTGRLPDLVRAWFAGWVAEGIFSGATREAEGARIS